MATQLSEGALEVIMSGGTVESPVMQILGSKKIASQGTNERYRLLVSDGRHLNSFAMVATQLNEMVASGELSEFTVVKIPRFITSVVSGTEKDRRVMVILELEVLKKGNEVGVRIGNPTQLDGSSSSSNGSSAPAKPAPAAAPALAQAGAAAKPSPARRAANGFGNQVKMSPGPSTPIHPISSLNPYQNKWCIKARVTNIQPMRTYTNARGEGKLFSVTFTDETGEIKCTGFNSAAEKFSSLLELGKVYLVSNCSLKTANKKFTQADYEMSFHDDSQVVPCSDDSNLPQTIFNFVSINKIAEMANESVVDVIGVARQTSDVQSLVSKNTGKELKKREIVLIDQTNVAVNLTLWGKQAEEFDGRNEPVIAAKGVTINEFMGGKSLSVRMTSTVQVNPDIEEAHRLRGWYDNGGAQAEISCISTRSGGTGGGSGNWVLQGEVASQGLGLGAKADYFSGVVTVMMLRQENCFYRACPGADCKKKVMDMNNGQFRCEKCNREYDNFVYRLMLSLQVSDYSGSNWVTAFHEEAEKILQCSGQEIGEAIEARDEAAKEKFTSVCFRKYQMKFRAKVEAYNDESRLKLNVMSAEPVDYKSYARRLLTEFKNEVGIRTTR